MNHELKIRAKRLRRAVSVVLGQDIKTSQSLELVARRKTTRTGTLLAPVLVNPPDLLWI